MTPTHRMPQHHWLFTWMVFSSSRLFSLTHWMLLVGNYSWRLGNNKTECQSAECIFLMGNSSGSDYIPPDHLSTLQTIFLPSVPPGVIRSVDGKWVQYRNQQNLPHKKGYAIFLMKTCEKQLVEKQTIWLFLVLKSWIILQSIFPILPQMYLFPSSAGFKESTLPIPVLWY